MSTPALDWSEDAFFEAPEPKPVDGGTTSQGHLWHIALPRWGHSMHTMCSYHGMFPAKLAHYFIQRYTRPGGVVLDPFSGRGTVALQARAEGLETYGRCPCGDLYRHRTAATVIAGQIHLASESVCPSCGERMQQVRDWGGA